MTRKLALRLAEAVVIVALLLAAAFLPAGATSPVKVSPWGDSITRGVDPGVVPFGFNYRDYLSERLTSWGYGVDFVGSQQGGATADNDHEGHNGWSISDLQDHAVGWIDSYHPDVILLMIGTNDQFSYLHETAPARLATLLDTIHAKDSSIRIVLSTVPQSEWSELVAERTLAYNAAIPGIAASRGWVTLTVLPAWIPLRDGVHPTPEGYRLIGTWYFSTVAGFLGAPTLPLVTTPPALIFPTPIATSAACAQPMHVATPTPAAGQVRAVFDARSGTISALSAPQNATILPPVVAGVGTASAVLTLTRATSSGPFQASAIVTDGCGEWRTFVGRGS